ncbi:MAG: hypothetical protein WAR37_01485 [Candidatus Microsaccharimonas sp.]
MFLGGLISWWYGRGWVGHTKRVAQRFSTTLEFFSIGQLFSTFFSPFRQISANTAGDGSFGGAFRAFIDKLISRVIGAFVRFFTIVFGLLVIVAQALYEGVKMVFWLILPVMPVLGFILLAIGWVPVWK